MSDRRWMNVPWRDVILATLVAGTWLAIMPQGIPWEALSLFSGTVMGRPVGHEGANAWTLLVHFGLAFVYSVLVFEIGVFLSRWRPTPWFLWAFVSAGTLYLLNRLIFGYLRSSSAGELRVLLTHTVFALVAALILRANQKRRKAEGKTQA